MPYHNTFSLPSRIIVVMRDTFLLRLITMMMMMKETHVVSYMMDKRIMENLDIEPSYPA
jgi:hypothetical protein